MKLFIACLLALAHGTTTGRHSTLGPRMTLIDRVSQLKPVYDYVIIGGGTSGLVVANRLTEDLRSKFR